MEFKIAAAKEESNKREETTRQLAKERVRELEQEKLAELTQLQQHHAQLVQLQQEKAALQLAEAERKAQEAEKNAQEARQARDVEPEIAADAMHIRRPGLDRQRTGGVGARQSELPRRQLQAAGAASELARRCVPC